MVTIKQVDREMALRYAIACHEANSMDEDMFILETILATHREQAVAELVEALEEIERLDRPTYEQSEFASGEECGYERAADIARQALAKYRNQE